MGCNQTSDESALIIPKMLEIPCTAEEMGKYLNDMRANPSKYAEEIEKELEKFTDEYSL